MAAVLAISSSALAQPHFTVIHDFAGGRDGASPSSALVLDRSGVLYGTTFFGGEHNRGTAFKMTPQIGGAWTESILHSFRGHLDGAYPSASLLLDARGSLYGTTERGGTVDLGIAFQLKHSQGSHWAETILHSFGTITDDARSPQTALIADGSGALYGTGLGGHFGFGAVYRLTPAGGMWTETTLYSFDHFDGYIPHDLLSDGSGSIYSTTRLGGTSDNGLVVALAPANGGGFTESTIHHFLGSPSDGKSPESGLSLGPDGSIYGTTSSGGVNDEGIVYRMTPQGVGSWSETVLYSFTGAGDGGAPQAGVIVDATGAIFGTAEAGGGSQLGVVFKLTPRSDGRYVESVLHSFTGGRDGGIPYGGLAQDSSGTLYGTTSVGGRSDLGVVFRL